jgi:hypothetical protein
MQLEYQSNTGDRRTVYNFGLVSALAIGRSDSSAYQRGGDRACNIWGPVRASTTAARARIDAEQRAAVAAQAAPTVAVTPAASPLPTASRGGGEPSAVEPRAAETAYQ